MRMGGQHDLLTAVHTCADHLPQRSDGMLSSRRPIAAEVEAKVMIELPTRAEQPTWRNGYAAGQRIPVQRQRICLLRQLDPEHISTCGRAGARARREEALHGRPHDVGILGKDLAQAAQVVVVAVILQVFG